MPLPSRFARLRPFALPILAASVLCLSGCGGGTATPSSGSPAVVGLPHAEVGLPSDPALRDRPRGVVMLIHGGGWSGLRPADIAAQRGAAQQLQDRGYATVNADYRAGLQGLRDLLARYDQAEVRFPGLPICLFGQSAGGHLALVIAARRKSVTCVISQAGPTDLPALRDARDPGGYRAALRAFGRARLRAFSPVVLAGRIQARVLQIAATNDDYVPIAQVRELQARLPAGRLIVLPPGNAPFVHSSVDAGALTRAAAAQQAFLDAAEPSR